MSENNPEYGNHVSPAPIPASTLSNGELPKRKRKPGKAIAAVAVGLLLFGGGIAVGSIQEPERVVTYVEGPEVEVPGPMVEVPTTPKSCLEAIDHFVTMTQITQGYIALIPEAASVGMDYDVAGAQMIADEMAELNKQVTDLTEPTGDAADRCRASAD